MYEYQGPIPDPEGYPVYQDPETGNLYRGLAIFIQRHSFQEWYVLHIITKTENDTIFYGYHVDNAAPRFQEFKLSDVTRWCGPGSGYDPAEVRRYGPPRGWKVVDSSPKGP